MLHPRQVTITETGNENFQFLVSTQTANSSAVLLKGASDVLAFLSGYLGGTIEEDDEEDSRNE